MSEDQPVRMRDSFVPGWPRELACPWGPYRAKVVEVHDGDTVTIEMVPFFDRREEVRVRIYGINAPELSTPEGKRARDFLRGLLPAGALVRFAPLVNEAGQATVSFGRQVGAMEYANGSGFAMNVAGTMVMAGHAVWCDRNLKPLDGPPPPIRRWVEPSA